MKSIIVYGSQYGTTRFYAEKTVGTDRHRTDQL